MAKAYSLDLRQRVFDLLKKGESKLSIARTLNVATKTILKWQKRYEKTGSMEKITPTVTRPRKVNYKEAKIFIEKNPDKTLKEIGVAIGTKDALYVIKKLGITYKKTLPIRGKAGRFERTISKDFKRNSKEKFNLS